MKGTKRFVALISALYAVAAGFLYLNDLMLFPADFLSWYYPFRGYQTFAEQSLFLRNLGYQDVVNCFFPYRAFIGKAVSQGHFPWWNPLEGAGLPPGALHSNGSYFPLSWFTYAVFSPLVAWHLDLTVQIFVCSIASFLLFRRWSGSCRAATLGALAWTFGGWNGSFFLEPPLTWPLALFPLVLLGLDDIKRGARRGVPVVALSIACSIFVGHMQIVTAAALLIAGYILYSGGKGRVTMLLACTAGVALAAPHLLALAELSSLSNRVPLSKEQILSLLLAPREFLGLFFQNIMGRPEDGFYLGRSLSSLVVDGREHGVYTGLVTVLLALLAALRAETKTVKLVTGLTVLGFGFAGFPFLYSALAAVFPPILYVTPLRFLPFVLFGVCYLASVGWVSFERQRLTKREGIAFGVILGSVLLGVATFTVPATTGSPTLAAWLLELAKKDGISKPPYFEGNFGALITERVFQHLSVSSFAVWFPLLTLTVLVPVVVYSFRSRLRFQIVLAVLIVDLGIYFFSMSVPVNQALFFPNLPELQVLAEGRTLTLEAGQMPSRVMGTGRGLHPSMLLPYGVANFESYQSIFPAEYRKIFTRLNSPRQLPHIIASTLDSQGLTPGLLDLFGVSLTYDHPTDAQRRDGSSNLQVTPRSSALRAFVTNRWKIGEEEEIYLPDFDPREAVILEVAPTFQAPETDQGFFRKVEPGYYGYDTVKFEVELENPALLVLTDLYYPGWTATVDGKQVPILKAYGFVRAVEVPAGAGQVVMTYRPTHFRWMVWAVVGGLILVVLAFYWVRPQSDDKISE